MYRDKRIFSTGCAGASSDQTAPAVLSLSDENAKLTDCYYERKDWRACKEEVSRCCSQTAVEWTSGAEMLPSYCRQRMFRLILAQLTRQHRWRYFDVAGKSMGMINAQLQKMRNWLQTFKIGLGNIEHASSSVMQVRAASCLIIDCKMVCKLGY